MKSLAGAHGTSRRMGNAAVWLAIGMASLSSTLGCGNGNGAAPTDAASDSTTTTSTATDGDMSEAATTDGGASDTTAVTLPSCFPSDYTLVPFVTTTPVRTFTKANQVLDPTKSYVAVLDTDVGCIAMSMHTTEAPISCNSFAFLTLHHFYDGIAFHRVIDGFVAQGGDPHTIKGPKSSWGTGGPGYYFGVELAPSLNFDAPGVVGMARGGAKLVGSTCTTDAECSSGTCGGDAGGTCIGTDPPTNGSQFFITLASRKDLDQQYTVFMQVTAGLDVLPKIVRGAPPATPTRITAAYIGVK